MENPDNKNATIEYTKFVQSSRHSEMKAIFDTFIPFVLFKKCLDKKEKDEQEKIIEDKKKKEEKETDKLVIYDLQKEAQIPQTDANDANKKEKENKNLDIEETENDLDKSEDPFDLTKDYDKVLNFNLITDEEKEDFRKGMPLPFLKNNVLNIISKQKMEPGTNPPQVPRQEQYHFQLISFKFNDKCLKSRPNVHFQQNLPLFSRNPEYQTFKSPTLNNNNFDDIFKNSNNNNSNYNKATTINDQKLSKNRFVKNNKSIHSKHKSIYDNNSSDSSEDEDNNKKKNRGDNTSNNMSFLDSDELNTFKNKDKHKSSDIGYRNASKFLSFNNARVSQLYQGDIISIKPAFYFKSENGKANKFIKFNRDFIGNEYIERTLNQYAIEENFPEFGNKIAIPSDSIRQEIFIFDPITIDPEIEKGKLKSFIFEEILKKRARLLFPYRQNFIKIIIIKLIQFLFIIKSKIANKKNMKNTSHSINYKKKNGKTKLKEIQGSNIITFSDVKPFMKSKFGHFDMEVFNNAYKEKKEKNKKAKEKKKIDEIQKKFLDILQKDDIEHPANDDEDNMKNEKRRNDANPQDIEKDSKMLLGAVYKPRKKMNYLNGLKMLIKEEATKNKGSNFKP